MIYIKNIKHNVKLTLWAVNPREYKKIHVVLQRDGRKWKWKLRYYIIRAAVIATCKRTDCNRTKQKRTNMLHHNTVPIRNLSLCHYPKWGNQILTLFLHVKLKKLISVKYLTVRHETLTWCCLGTDVLTTDVICSWMARCWIFFSATIKSVSSRRSLR